MCNHTEKILLKASHHVHESIFVDDGNFMWILPLSTDIIGVICGLIFAHFLHVGIEVKHPIFAILYQDIWFANTLGALSIALFTTQKFLYWNAAYAVLNFASNYFHDTTWLVVALLR